MSIYKELLRHTRDITSQTDFINYLFYSEKIVEQDDWPTNYYVKKLQSPGTLGEKIIAAFREVFNSCDSCIIIGSDCPRLNTNHIDQAFESLSLNDIVIGPSFDGGYYLLGMNELHEAIFTDIDWSTPQVYEQTISKIKSLGLTHHSLEQLSDIDYIEDWEKWGWDIK